MNIFYEDGRGRVFNESGEEASTFFVEPSFRLTNLTNLQEYIKNKKVVTEVEACKDTEMTEKPIEKERNLVYNIYTVEERQRYFYYLQQRLMKPTEAAKAGNVNPETARKWKLAYDKDPNKQIPVKKTNRTSNYPKSQLGDEQKAYLTNFYDENPTATIQDAVENWSTASRD